MRRLFLVFLVFAAMLTMAACRREVAEIPDETPPPRISDHGAQAVEWINHINDNFYSRLGFTYRELETAKWLVDELLAMGYNPDDIVIQEFEHFHNPFWPLDFEHMVDLPMFYGTNVRDSRLSQNVILTIPGQSDSVIIVGAHYDSVGYPGASDNASGMALLLESAYRMRELDNYHTLVYIFFGAEEVGLIGAFYYIDSLTSYELDNIVFMLNADVLFEGTYFIYAAGQVGAGAILSNELTQKWDYMAYGLRNEHDLLLIPYYNGLNFGSDHIPFMQEGITVIFLMGLEAAGNTFRPAILHSYRDDVHWINENRPGKIKDAMWTFSIFLEEILLARYN
ncbi:MAG: M28 family peptidase [Clostridiales bacterium]|jgi:hypothetical protein|nr:M28 family peptidase [Clostridiales bacterium]